jgi:spore maturation protein CgeB
MKLLCLGPIWRGSNAGGLFKAIARKGNVIQVIDEFYHIALEGSGFSIKATQKLMRPFQLASYNRQIIRQISTLVPDVLFVYKGAFVKPETISFAKSQGCKAVMFYPDVSMTFHGSLLPQSIPLYDLVFTTKTFGITDLRNKFNVTSSFFIPHGFDPEIHRTLPVTSKHIEDFGCDISFIGTWSPKKESMLGKLITKLPDAHIRIWGDQWGRATDETVLRRVQGKAVLGDLYALAVQCSKINLGLLSERVAGASSGDRITSRTFHIPGAGGFLLHEENDEALQYFTKDIDAGFFRDDDDLISQVRKYLSDNTLRERVRLAGYKRAQTEHSLDNRAQLVLEKINFLR